MAPHYKIRAGNIDDIPEVLHLVRELAVYERLEDQVSATPELYREHGFGSTRRFETRVVETKVEGKIRLIAFALYFFTFSTFLGKPTLYLEDLFVTPDFRGKGIGKALLAELAKIAEENRCGRMEWMVLDWNEPAIEFYKSLNATPLSDWHVFRLNEADIHQLAGQS